MLMFGPTRKNLFYSTEIEIATRQSRSFTNRKSEYYNITHFLFASKRCYHLEPEFKRCSGAIEIKKPLLLVMGSSVINLKHLDVGGFVKNKISDYFHHLATQTCQIDNIER